MDGSDKAPREDRVGIRWGRGRTPLGPAGLVGAIFLVVFAVVAVVAPLLPIEPNHQILPLRLAGPRDALAAGGWEYVLGADPLGRPLLSRIIYGARVSLIVAIAAPLIAMVVGIPIGLLAAEFKGRVDRVSMRMVDVWMSMPPLLMALALLYLAGPGAGKTVLILGLLRWVVFARLTRAMALSVSAADYVVAARATGCSRFRVMIRHVLPNCQGELRVLMALESARALLAESALSFIGLGIRPPQSSWGTIIESGRDYIAINPLIVVFGGAAILATTLSINVVVGSIQDRDRVIDYG